MQIERQKSIWEIIKHGTAEKLREFLQVVPEAIGYFNDRGETPLYLAVQLQEIEMAKLLLEHGADPFVLNREGATPFSLLRMVQYSHGISVTIDIAKKFIAKKFNIAPQDVDDTTLSNAQGISERDRGLFLSLSKSERHQKELNLSLEECEELLSIASTSRVFVLTYPLP